MEWFRKHTDAMIVLSGIVASMLWMNSKFNDIDMKFAGLDKEITVMKTVMLLKNIYPQELCAKEEGKNE